MKIARLFITIIILYSSIFCLSGCDLFDRDGAFIRQRFDTSLPGYSSIKILKKEGTGNSSSPRVLTLRVTMDVFPEPIIAEAQLSYAVGNPTDSMLEWFSVEGAAYDTFISRVQNSLEEPVTTGYNSPFKEKVSLLLKHWIDKKLIKLDDITEMTVRNRVEELIDTWNEIPDEIKNTPLISVPPDISENEKYIAYGLRADGTISVYLGTSPGPGGVDPREEAYIGFQYPGQNTIIRGGTYSLQR